MARSFIVQRRKSPHPTRGTTRSQRTVVRRSEQVTPNPKEILDESMHRQESLRVHGGLEPSHLSLALSGRLVRDLGSVVLILVGAVHNRRQDRAVGSRVAAQLIRDQSSRFTALPLQ